MRRDKEDLEVRYESYLLRVWHDVPKRFVVENVQTGQKHGFVSWARLEAWLEGRLKFNGSIDRPVPDER